MEKKDRGKGENFIMASKAPKIVWLLKNCVCMWITSFLPLKQV